jgi:hypothetical protein
VHVLVVSPGYVRTALSLNALTGDGTRCGRPCMALALATRAAAG